MTVKLNLDRVMFERGNMKVPELQALTGLNKNTLYSFYKGDIKRFDVETIDKLCEALKCTPGELIEHIPTSNKEIDENAQ